MTEFLEESWEHLKNPEKTSSQEKKSVDLYSDIREKSERDSELKSLMDQVNTNIANYVQYVIENKKSWRAQQ